MSHKIRLNTKRLQEVRITRRVFLQAASQVVFAGALGACNADNPQPVSESTAQVSPTSTPTNAVATNTPTALPSPTVSVAPIASSPATPCIDSAHVITDLCIRDGACMEVCPVECIVPGCPESDWPWYYVDPDTCIACGACVPECPVGAALPACDLPESQQYAIELNALYFIDGPGYAALDMCL